MEQSKERPVFTEHPPMSKIIRAEATKFPVLDQAQPKSAKKLYDAFHDNTDDTVERYDNKRFSVCGIIKLLRGKLRAAETAAYFRRYSLPDCACGHQTAHNHYDERRASVTC